MKNSADQGGCYPQEAEGRGSALQNSSYLTEAEFNNCFIIHSKYFPVLKRSFAFSHFVFPLTKNDTTFAPGFLGQRFNNL